MSLVVSPAILSFTVTRYNDIERDNSSFRYPILIDFMDQFSNQYQPNYELFAVVANRGQDLITKDSNSQYVTLVKKENGEVYEYDPEAEAPKKLADPKLILNEQKSVEMLFYREVECRSQENSES